MASGKFTFLDAAEAVLGRVGRPLGPDELTERALEADLIRSSGQTPSQTMKSKLSTDILDRREGSRFMRTDYNVFALRSWSDRFPEFVADRFQKALLDEEVVVFPRDDLPRYVTTPGVHSLSREQSEDLVARTFSIQRREAEERFDLIQLVSAFLVERDGRYATYKRTKRLPESRLHGFFSLLFGGHLNPEDVPPLFGTYSIFDPRLGPTYIQRELSEELRFSDPPELSLIGVIYDDRREVSTQHLGVMYSVRPTRTASIEIGERGFLQQLRFETAEEIASRIDEFENWSELVLREFLVNEA